MFDKIVRKLQIALSTVIIETLHFYRKILTSTENILSNKTKKRVLKVGVEYVCYCGRGST